MIKKQKLFWWGEKEEKKLNDDDYDNCIRKNLKEQLSVACVST